MPISNTISAPRQLPFHAESFGWEHFERFCAAYFIACASLPNFNIEGGGPSRLRILDAVRYGTSGAKQRGIDILARMENRSTWVLQCKHMLRFTKGDAQKAIAKAEAEFGARQPARYLLWVTGKVATDALDLVHEHHSNWTLWDGERISNEFLLHTPRRQAFQIITSIFGVAWAKAFFPLPDDLLITTGEFYSRWAGEKRLFHHQARFVGRQTLLDRVAAFAQGGKSTKALILSAPGGIGKTRLLRAIAERIEKEAPRRLVRFTNPDASPEAEPPRFEDASLMTVFHDDAHRIETLPGLLVGILAAEKSKGSRLVLAARPGTEQVLRGRLMESGYTSANIETLSVEKLNKSEMEQLATACLGIEQATACLSIEQAYLVKSLTEISEGCALITMVGGELLRHGEQTHLDLIQSANFRAEVFRRFEGQELDRIGGSLDRPMKEKLLRSIALLSPWDHLEHAKSIEMAGFLGVARGQLEALCDTLLASGLLIRTHKGLRITPDLFSDHLVYSACYDEKGQTTEFIRKFLDCFAETHSQVILNNLAETEWRAIKQHGATVTSVIAPIWQRFLSDFTKATFWDRSQMLERWAAFAVYQPERSLELAAWALDMNSAPEKTGYNDMSTHERVLIYVPKLLKPVAIWCNRYRQAALDLLWRLRRDFPMPESGVSEAHYGVFAEIAKFEHNFPDAPTGVLDWLDRLLESPAAGDIADRPCGLLEMVLRPFFTAILETTHMSDNRTFVFSKIPISVSKTQVVRHRALSFLTDKIIPRGTVAAINAMPVLAEAFSQNNSGYGLPSAMEREWRPERMLALQSIADVANRYRNSLIHYAIRHHLHRHIIYGKDEGFREACEKIVSSLPDTLEFRLARFTLSWSHDDLFESYDQKRTEQRRERQKSLWKELGRTVAQELLGANPDARSAHDFLDQWSRMCSDHGLTTHLGELLSEIASNNQALGLEMLGINLQHPQSELACYAAPLIALGGNGITEPVERIVLRGLNSTNQTIERSFLNAIQYRDDLRSDRIEKALLNLAARAKEPVLQTLFSMIELPVQRQWNDSLILTLLDRKLTDDEASKLANALWHHLQYGDGHLNEIVIIKMMERIAESSRIEDDGSGFLHEMARRYPRRMYELLIKRIELQECELAEGRAGFQALPYSNHFFLDGIENEPDFESLARGLMDRVFASRPELRWSWNQMFRMVVARTSPLIETLLYEHLPAIDNPDGLANAAVLLGFEGSLLVFKYHSLVEAILKKARNFGPEEFDRITWKLIHGTGPEVRGYTNGELEPQYRYLRSEAEKAALIHESNQVLSTIYQKIVEMEVRDEERHRKEQEALMSDDW